MLPLAAGAPFAARNWVDVFDVLFRISTGGFAIRARLAAFMTMAQVTPDVSWYEKAIRKGWRCQVTGDDDTVTLRFPHEVSQGMPLIFV